MSIFQRIATIFGAKATKLWTRPKTPTKTLDYSYQKQLELLQKVRRGVADVATSRKRLELQINQLEQQQNKLSGQAEKAMQIGREDLAREALTRKSGLTQQITDLQTQHEGLQGESRSSLSLRSACRPRSTPSARRRRLSRPRTTPPTHRPRSAKRFRASPKSSATSDSPSSAPRTRPRHFRLVPVPSMSCWLQAPSTTSQEPRRTTSPPSSIPSQARTTLRWNSSACANPYRPGSEKQDQKSLEGEDQQ